jgi:putative nucleotidyltransferase with HDIG domain
LYDSLGQTIETTFVESPVLGPLTALEVLDGQDSQSKIRTFSTSGIQYSEVLGAWKVRGNIIGVMGASFSQNFLVRMGQSNWMRAFALVSGSTFMVIAVGIFISNLISQPILRLEKAASLIAKGNLEIQVVSSGRDEVARLTREFNAMVERLQKARKDLISAYDNTIEGWAKTLEARDHETLGHSHRVVDLTLKLARAMGIPENELDNVRRGAFLHDIGKLTIPDEILRKPGPLTKEEWEIVKKHPKFAYEFLKDIEFLKNAINIPYCHHEYWDGSGYPRGLKGTQIPLEARIFTVVDVYDAIRSERPYHKARSIEETLQALRKGRGIIYDPEVIDTFLCLMQEKDNEPAAWQG